MEGDGEAVCLVAQALQQVEGIGAPAQTHGIGRSGPVDLLELLGQRGQLDLALEPQLAHDPLGHAELALAAVDEEQVGPVGEAAGVRSAPRAPPSAR